MSSGAGVAIFFGFVIVATIGWILLSRAVDTSIEALFRHIFFRKSHKTGDYLIKNPLVFKTHASFDTLKTRIFNDIVPPDRNASWVPSLYLASAGTEPNGEYVALFRKDTKMNYGLDVEVRLRQDAAGVVGSVDVVRWRLEGGVIQHVNEMKLLRQRVEQIVLELDPQAELSHRSEPTTTVQPAYQQLTPQLQSPWVPQQQPPPPAQPVTRYPAAPGVPQNPAMPPPQPQPITPRPGSRYAVPDTSSWVDRNQQ
ncbi:hypothetical protein [Mycolicibacterium vinylchloridicum]|uniref:hypothetical protein n=1 Tax=Mycolicibacterium vinylchloridicum TaxID=2736928 RepID=UPI0015CDAAEF|nr:hypothetical protein [Mycolicibacterium vinylchloridicum]